MKTLGRGPGTSSLSPPQTRVSVRPTRWVSPFIAGALGAAYMSSPSGEMSKLVVSGTMNRARLPLSMETMILISPPA